MNKTCSSGKVVNPETGRCVLRTGRIGKNVLTATKIPKSVEDWIQTSEKFAEAYAQEERDIVANAESGRKETALNRLFVSAKKTIVGIWRLAHSHTAYAIVILAVALSRFGAATEDAKKLAVRALKRIRIPDGYSDAADFVEKMWLALKNRYGVTKFFRTSTDFVAKFRGTGVRLAKGAWEFQVRFIIGAWDLFIEYVIEKLQMKLIKTTISAGAGLVAAAVAKKGHRINYFTSVYSRVHGHPFW